MENINIKNFGAGLFSLAFSAVLVSGNAWAACATVPNCATLGYVMDPSKCYGPKLFCPSDVSKAYCVEKQAQMYVGDIYFSDGTSSRDIVSSKTAIGVVFWVSNDKDAPAGSKGLVIALDETQKPWNDGTQNQKDIPTLTNFTSVATAKADMDGKSNTSKIMAFQNSDGQKHQAADYCATYITAGTNKGDWFLPALGQLDRLSHNYASVNVGLGKLGKELLLENNGNWSSSEYNNDRVWFMFHDGDANYDDYKYNNEGYVRPVMQF